MVAGAKLTRTARQVKKSEIKKLDKIWADKVKDLAGRKCEYCKRTEIRLEAAHVVGRRHRTTRWGREVDGNYDLCGHCLCHTCHQNYDEHGPLESLIVRKVIGLERKRELQRLAKISIAKHQYYEEIKQRLEEL